jgi:ribonuclease VapC
VIVLDTSAILAMLWNEPEADVFKYAIADVDGLLLSAPTRPELQIVCLRRRGPGEVENIERFISDFDVLIEPFDGLQLNLAMQAHEVYGKGRYGLNYGDCFSYALAKSRDLPLLFKGEDFAATDVKRAV